MVSKRATMYKIKWVAHYLELMRFHKPVGIFLLLWPTLWALWIASGGFPSTKNLFIFIGGVVLMRAAGCVINDIADRKLDLQVKRTQTRLITSGKISVHNALLLFFALCLMAFLLVLMTNPLTILLSFFALCVATFYPFAKRYTHFPQVILGIAFSFAIPMAFSAVHNHIPAIAWLIMIINMLWTVMYDTLYAMVDRDDDLKIGIKSTAILFGKCDKLMIGLLQLTVITLLCLLGFLLNFLLIYFVAVFIALLLFIYQQKLISDRIPDKCFQAFLNNQWVGLIVFIGIL